MAPNHVAARVQLSLLQQQLGMDQEALHTLAEGGGWYTSWLTYWVQIASSAFRDFVFNIFHWVATFTISNC